MTAPYPCLGSLVDWDRPRDSIHIAIIPVVAARHTPRRARGTQRRGPRGAD